MRDPWQTLIHQATTNVEPKVPHYYVSKKKPRVTPTHCRQCGKKLIIAPQAYTKLYCDVDCKKAFNRAAYAAKKNSHAFCIPSLADGVARQSA